MTPEELRRRTAAWRNAHARAARELPGRDTAIRDALAAGIPQRTIAREVGVSAGRIGQIASGR